MLTYSLPVFRRSLLLTGICVLIRFSASGQHGIPILRKQLAQCTTDTSRCRITYALGDSYKEENLDSCLYFLEQSLVMAQRQSDSFATARALCELGFVHIYLLKNEAKAITFINRAISIASINQDNLHLAKGYWMLSAIGIHQQIGNPDALLAKALAHAEKTNNWEVKYEVLAIRAMVARSRQQYQATERNIVRAMNVCRTYNNDYWFTCGLDYLDVLLLQGKKTQAEQLIRKLDAEKNKLLRTKGAFIYTNDVARLAVLQKNYNEATTILHQGIAVENKRAKPDSLHLLHYYVTLVDAYDQQGDYQRAYLYGKELADLRLWVQRVRQTRDAKLQITNQKAVFDLAQKDGQIKLLATEKSQQRLLLYLSVMITGLTVGFLIIIYRNRKHIIQQKAELGQLNTAKDKLFAILSHDLRSPVASLKNYIMLIDWGALSKDEFAESINSLTLKLNGVHITLENILSWSRAQMEGIRARPTLVDTYVLIQEQIKLQQVAADQKGIRVENQVLPDTYLLADSYHLTIIFRNLLQNALKFTNRGGYICFSCEANDTVIAIIVSDSGIGMSEKIVNRLRSAGQQGLSSESDTDLRTGLGLYLVKELVNANQGQLHLVSEEGIGTTITLQFKQDASVLRLAPEKAPSIS